MGELVEAWLAGDDSPNKASYSLFITLPDSEVVRIKDLPPSISTFDLYEKLELLAGLPSGIYTFHTTDGTPIDETQPLVFHLNISDGAVVKARLQPLWVNLYEAVLTNSRSELSSHLKRGAEAASTAQAEAESHYAIFVCLFLCCHKAVFDLVKYLVTLDNQAVETTTCFGRTLLHSAVSKDNILVLHLLLQHGLDYKVKDVLDQSAMDVALQNGAHGCVRLIKDAILHIDRRPKPRRKTTQSVPSRLPKQIHRPEKQPTDDVPIFKHDVRGLMREVKTMLECTVGGQKAATTIASSTTDLEPVTNKRAETKSARLTRSAYHSACHKDKPFVAKRYVDPEEQRKLVTVDFVPVDASCDGRVTSNTSVTWPKKPLQFDPMEKRRKTGTGAATSKRQAKSAQYYETKYHRMAREEIDYKARPATAGSRFRFWKTWLLEKLEQDAARAQPSADDVIRQKKNAAAFRRWLRRKNREPPKETEEEEDSEDSSDEEEEEDANEKAFQDWLKQKRAAFARAARKKRERELMEQQIQEADGPPNVYNRRVTIFEMASTEPYPVRYEPASRYHVSYKRLTERRQRYEAWKERNSNVATTTSETGASGTGSGGDPSKEEVSEIRKTLLLQGMTYEEWVGLKERQSISEKTPRNKKSPSSS